MEPKQRNKVDDYYPFSGQSRYPLIDALMAVEVECSLTTDDDVHKLQADVKFVIGFA